MEQGVKVDSSDFQLHVLSTLENTCHGQFNYNVKWFFCFPFPSNTSGVKCTWSGGGYLEIDLHHCSDPVNYHVLLNAPGNDIFRNITLKNGDSMELLEHVQIHVTELSREGNQVTTVVSFTLLNINCLLSRL